MKSFIQKNAEQIARSFLDRGEDPTGGVVKVARQNNLNPHQIERVSTQTNRNIIVGLQKQAVKDDEIDPHFTFPKVSTQRVMTIIASPSRRASAQIPEDRAPQKSLDEVLPPVDDPMPAPEKTPEEIEASDDLEFDDANTGHEVLSRIKQKVDAAEEALDTIEIELGELAHKIEKTAEIEMLNGTPIEVLEQIGAASSIFEKVASSLHEKGERVTHDDTPWSVNPDHPLVKQARRFETLLDRREGAKQELDRQNERAKLAHHQILRCD